MGAAVDCEAIGAGFLSQPVNAITSLAFVVAAVVVWSQTGDRWVSAGLAAVGFGSFLFHGPLAPGGVWIHDVTLAWLILMLGLRTRDIHPIGAAIGLAAIGPTFLIEPAIAEPFTAALLIATVYFALLSDRTRNTLMPLGLLALSAAIGRIGATGSPLCVPGSVLQAHSLWHIGAAVAVAWWVNTRETVVSSRVGATRRFRC
jgi:hypothetical protein